MALNTDADLFQEIVNLMLTWSYFYLWIKEASGTDNLLNNNAFGFLYTSLRESFGIPLLEGMACGVPVITSNTSSMPEIGGPDAILVNPESSDEIADMMLRLERDPEFYQRQQAVGLELLKLYEEVYQEIQHPQH